MQIPSDIRAKLAPLLERSEVSERDEWLIDASDFVLLISHEQLQPGDWAVTVERDPRNYDFALIRYQLAGHSFLLGWREKDALLPVRINLESAAARGKDPLGEDYPDPILAYFDMTPPYQ